MNHDIDLPDFEDLESYGCVEPLPPSVEALDASEAVLTLANLTSDGAYKWRLIGLSDALSDLPACPPTYDPADPDSALLERVTGRAYEQGYALVYPPQEPR